VVSFWRTFVLAVISATAYAQTTPIAFTGARIIPISGPEIPSGTLLVQNG